MFKKIVVVGLGLMGGSLAASVRKNFPSTKVVGVARRKETLDFASKKKWIHEGCFSLSAALRGADLVVICTPVDLTKDFLKEIDQCAAQEVLVTDVGSVKFPICSFAKKNKWKKLCFVGAHPMVGSHEQGIEFARADLYDSGLTIVTPSGNKKADKKVLNFWSKISDRVVALNSKQHDRAVAEVSHLPHLLSVCLMASASPDAIHISGSGFRDMTRLAAGPASIWNGIFLHNAPATLQALHGLEKQISQFKRILKSSDSSKLISLLDRQSKRRKLI